MNHGKRPKLPRGLRWDPKSSYICFSWRDVRRVFSTGRQRTPRKINMLAHTFNVSNSSSFPSPPCTESAEEPLNRGQIRQEVSP
jgi:hypothetical protein